MAELSLELTSMAHGGAALGRDRNGRVIFVPYAIPGEHVKVATNDGRSRFSRARLLDVIEASPERTSPRCAHFGVCGGCHFQHIAYDAQLQFKQQVVVDQLARLASIKQAPVRAPLPNPLPYGYQFEAALSPVAEGGVGYWSPARQAVIPISECPILSAPLPDLLVDVDLDLPNLRSLTLRVGDDGAILAALTTHGVEPPGLETDFPISVAIVLPDGTAANLIGDNYSVMAVHGRDFRVSAGVAFHASPVAVPLLVDTVLAAVELSGRETVIEGYSGCGTLTGFLADGAAAVKAVERNADAVADAIVNLDAYDNIALYQDTLADALPALEITPDVVVLDPPAGGIDKRAWAALRRLEAPRLVLSSGNVATMARDAATLRAAGYQLAYVQPIDMTPQHFEVHTVSLWLKG